MVVKYNNCLRRNIMSAQFQTIKNIWQSQFDFFRKKYFDLGEIINLEKQF